MGLWALYAIIKGSAYVAWCCLGAKVHGHQDRMWLKAVGYGILRLVLGLVMGLVLILWLVNALSPGIHSNFILYLAVYVPVRWFEWSLLAVLMDVDDRSLKHFLIGRTARSRLWRMGGIGISCLADLPLVIAVQGLPIGRFMC